MAVDLLAQLKDIHYPKPIPIWPLAPGWYILIAFLICLFSFTLYYWYRYLKKHQLKKLVLLRLEQLKQQQEINTNIAEELSMLLKRAVLASYPRHQVASLHGEEWLNFLDRTSMTTEFSQGAGQLLIISPYQGKKQKLPDQLFELIKNWVKKNL